MTNIAQHDDIPAPTMAEPDRIVTIPAPSRPARIAAMHAAGAFLADSPELPMPSDVNMIYHGATWQQLKATAQLHGVEILSGAHSCWIHVPVAMETLHGITITYVMFGPDARGQQRADWEECQFRNDYRLPQQHAAECGIHNDTDPAE